MLLETTSEDSRRAIPERRAHYVSFTTKKNNLKKNKRKTTCLPHETVEYLKAWMMSPAHIAHPYPTEQEKLDIMADTGIELKQLINWFVNNRKRFWKPQVEAQMFGCKEAPKLTTSAAVVQPSPVGKHKNDVKMPEPVSPILRGMVGKAPSSSSSASFSSTKRTVSMVSLVDEGQTRPVVSPLRATVSERSSSCSISSEDDESLSSDEDTKGSEPKMETIMVYILRPQLGGKPTMEDVVTDIDENMTANVLEQFEFVRNSTNNPASPQTELDGIKVYFLQKYLTSVTTPVDHDDDTSKSKRTRSFDDTEDAALEVPRPKYRRVSIDMWKEACQSARDGYDSSLPSLEEAANLFGFADPVLSSQV